MHEKTVDVSSAIPTLEIGSQGLSVRRQYDLWQSFGSSFAMPRDETGFDFSIKAAHLGEMLLSNCRQGRRRVIRSADMIRADHRDHYVLCTNGPGGGVGQGDADGRSLTFREGEMLVIDQSQPIQIHASPESSVTLILPRDLVHQVLPPGADMHGLVLRSGLGALLATHLLALERTLPTIAPAQIGGLNRATLHLFAAAVSGSMDDLLQAEPAIDAALRLRAERYIETMLAHSSLSVGTVCAALQASRARLYKVFAASGGVKAYIQSRRLARARIALRSGVYTTIGQVAHHHGFPNEAHFSRLFHHTYGCSPKAARSRSGTPDWAPPAGRQARSLHAPNPGSPNLWATWLENLSAPNAFEAR